MTDIPGSVPIHVRCVSERRVITHLSRAALRAMIRGGLLPTDTLIVHWCRRCSQAHLLLAGDLVEYVEMRRAG